MQVRALLLIDSVAITALNAIVAALDLGADGFLLAESVTLCSFIIAALCAATLSVLLAGFCWHAYKGAGAEEGARVANSPRKADTDQAGVLVRPSSAAMFPPDTSPIVGSPRLLGSLGGAVMSEVEYEAPGGSGGISLSPFPSLRGYTHRAPVRTTPTPGQSAAVAALATGASQDSEAVCAACAAVRSLLQPSATSAVSPAAGRAGVAAGLLAGGALTALASLLSGPLAAQSDVVVAVSTTVAALASAAMEGDGTVPIPKLESSALVSLSRGLAESMQHHARESHATLIAACDALTGVCATSDAAGDTAARAFPAAGGVASLADSLSRCRGAARLSEAAAVCHALRSIAGSDVGLTAAVTAGVPRSVAALISVLASQPPQPLQSRVLAGACSVVACIAIDEGGAEQFFAADGVTPLISAASAYLGHRGREDRGLEEDWPALVLAVVQAACDALYSLKSYSWGRNTLVASGAVQLLRKARAAYADNGAIEDSALWALQALQGAERRLSLGTVVPVL